MGEAASKGLERKWKVWRGSPELLAQIVRVTLRATGADATEDSACQIDLEVDRDHEIFASPDEFSRDVTREALRRFARAEVRVRGPKGTAGLTLTRESPWSNSPKAEIRLWVDGPYLAWDKATLKAVSASIERAGRAGNRLQRFLVFVIAYGSMTASSFAFASGLFLLNLSPARWILLAFTTVAIAAGTVWGSWLYPPLEIAPPGQTNLARVLRFGGPLVVGFLLSGLAKLAYG